MMTYMMAKTRKQFLKGRKMRGVKPAKPAKAKSSKKRFTVTLDFPVLLVLRDRDNRLFCRGEEVLVVEVGDYERVVQEAVRVGYAAGRKSRGTEKSAKKEPAP